MPSRTAKQEPFDTLGSLPSWEQPEDFTNDFTTMLPNLTATGFSREHAQSQLHSQPSMAAAAQLSDGTERMSSKERRQHKNALAQKRLREKKKVQTQQLELQFAASSAELRELKQKQKSLEARNLLLEKLVNMSKMPQQATSAPASAQERGPDMSRMWDNFQAVPEPFARIVTSSPVRLTLFKGKERLISPSQAGQISGADFAQMYSDYSHAFSGCLMDIQQDSNSPALKQLRTLVLEWKQLIVSIALNDPVRFKEIMNSRMDEGQPCSDTPPDLYAKVLIALDYTESQVQDTLHLRQLLFHKQGQLARERRALLSKIEANSAESFQDAKGKFVELTQYSEQLRQNGAMEYRAYMEYCGAYHAGILTSEQSAKGMVYAYPHWPKHDLVLEELAKERGQPSMQALLEDTSVDDTQHAANWEEVIRYAKTITLANIHEYVPLLSRQQ